MNRGLAWAMMAAAAALLMTACGGGDDDAPKVEAPPTQRETRLGTVNGLDLSASSGTYAWLGVPYAQPPVGALRWAPPVDATPWAGVRATQQFGHSCAQGGRYFSPAPNGQPFGLAVRDGLGKPVGEEDCLTLNIWRPSTTDTNLPVIMFIYGGSNISGYSADPSYDGQQMAKRANAVVVTLNYRVGFLGWLDLPQLKTGEAANDSGNFALLDQIQALKFVRDNITSFGGDAGNVTVMGQSAGGVNTWALVVSPSATGLLHKAVPMSGGIAFQPRTTAQTYSRALLNVIAIADGKATDTASANAWVATQTNAQIAAYLRSFSSNQLLTIALANPQLGNSPAPIEDGSILPVNSRAVVAGGTFNRVPMIVGNTKDEGTLFANLFGLYTGTNITGFKLNDYDRFSQQFIFNPDMPTVLTPGDFINSAYLPADALPAGWNAMSAFVTNAIFINGLSTQINSVSAQLPTRTWYYRFDWNEEPAPFDTVYGATHGLDTVFFFHNFGSNVFSFAYSNANKPGREALSDAMIGSLSAFARTGDPNHAGLGVTWPVWPGQIVFDASKTTLQNSVP